MAKEITHSPSTERLEDMEAYFEARLGGVEKLRTYAAGEVYEQGRVSPYMQVVNESQILFNEALKEHKQNESETTLKALAGSALTAATTNQSLAKHGELPDDTVELLLDSSVNWLKKLEEYRNPLSQINSTFHGPILWNAEIERVWARSHERRVKDRENHLEKAQKHYQKAIEVCQGKIVGLDDIESDDEREIVRLAALSAGGVAMGELARVRDMILHEFEGNRADEKKDIHETDILELYEEGRDMVWDTREVPNYDRLDAVEGRVLRYLIEHEVPTDHPAFEKTVDHLSILATESDMVRERMQRRIEQRLIPEEFHHLFH